MRRVVVESSLPARCVADGRVVSTTEPGPKINHQKPATTIAVAIINTDREDILCAGDERIELPTEVLETSVIPLN